jgi:CHASE3 domain sensor protein
MNEMSDPPQRPKGHRPYYFDDPAIDQLHSAVLALTGELAVALDRIDSLERQLAARGVVPADAIDSYRPDAAASQARMQRYTALADRILKPFKDYRENLFERQQHAHKEQMP